MNQLSISGSVGVAFLSALLGSFVATIILCVGLLFFGSGFFSLEGIIGLFMLAAIAGTMGVIFSAPLSMLFGAPIVRLWGYRMAASPLPFSLLLSMVGAVGGWAVFAAAFDGGIGSADRTYIIACLIYGATVAGTLPIMTSWLFQAWTSIPIEPT